MFQPGNQNKTLAALKRSVNLFRNVAKAFFNFKNGKGCLRTGVLDMRECAE